MKPATTPITTQFRNAKVDLLRILESSNLTPEEWADVTTILRRSKSGELTKKDCEDFVESNDAPTRAQAFANLARWNLQANGKAARHG